MKKSVSILMTLTLVLTLFAVPVMAETESSDKTAIGYLSYLNMSEGDALLSRETEIPAFDYLEKQGVYESVGRNVSNRTMVPYDSLDAMLMGLTSGEVDYIDVPDSTARYLCRANDQVKQAVLYHPEKVEGFSQELVDRLSNGYSFMMLEENSDLRDQFDQVIAEMKKDGTLDELIKTHITDVAESGEPAAVTFEEFEGEPIKVAVTGSLPPMDYVAADGSFAGFNTAILAEIGKRLEKNIELVQVDSIGRALALAQGNVDVSFWTRARSEGSIADDTQLMSKEEKRAYFQKKAESHTDEENNLMKNVYGSLPREVFRNRDMPEGTVVTAPYYTDLNVLVALK